MCLGIVYTISALFPGYKSPFTSKGIMKAAKKIINDESGEAELHNLISRLYFETRKAIEFRASSKVRLKNKKSTRRKKNKPQEYLILISSIFCIVRGLRELGFLLFRLVCGPKVPCLQER